MSLNVTPKGILNGRIVEPHLVLSDGSKWQLMLFHLVDKGKRLFTSSNATYCNDFGLFSRLAWIDNFTYGTGYEFYVIQDGTIYRWSQTSAPTASTITGLTAITGNPVNGLAKGSQGNTYIGYNSWWGACGCWTSYTTGGKTGIPAFGAHSGVGICEDYLALYARVEKFNAFAEDQIINGGNIYEY